MMKSTLPDAFNSQLTLDERPPVWRDPWIWVALAVGLALRVWEAAESSLWFDELISLRRASMPDPQAVVNSVGGTLHTPLFFVALQLAGDFSSGAWLRVVPVLSSLLLVLLAVLFARSLGWNRDSTRAAALLMAVMPYQVHYGAELRPYAWLAVTSAAAAWLVLTPRRSPWRDLALFAAVALLGLANHRAMAITLVGLALARIVVRGPRLIALVPLGVAGALAMLPFLEFFVEFAMASRKDLASRAWRLGEVDMGPKMLKNLALVPLRLLEPRFGMLGPGWMQLALVSTLAVLATTGLGLISWVRTRPRWSPTGWGLLILAGTGFLLLTALQLERRGAVAVQQYAGVAWIAPLALVACLQAVRSEGRRRALLAVLVLGGLGMGIALAGGHSRSELRGGVALAQSWAEEMRAQRSGSEAAPLFTAFVPGPPNTYASNLLYKAWAPDLQVTEPKDLPRPDEPGHKQPILALMVILTEPYAEPELPGRIVTRRQELDRYVKLLLYEAN